MTPAQLRAAGLTLPWAVWQHGGGWWASLPEWRHACYVGDTPEGAVRLLRRLEGEQRG